MLRLKIIYGFIAFILISCMAQKPALSKQEADEVAGLVAKKIMNCCSSFGGNKLHTEIEYSKIQKSEDKKAIIIPMKIGWYGSITGDYYWILGNLKLYSNGIKEWEELRNSGGLSGRNCFKNCIH